MRFRDKLKDHLKHHERAARNFECQQCQQRFVQKSDLNRHIRGVHQGEPGVGINMGTKRRAPGNVTQFLACLILNVMETIYGRTHTHARLFRVPFYQVSLLSGYIKRNRNAFL